MDMVRHDAPRPEGIAQPVKVQQSILDNGGGGATKHAFAMTTMEVGLAPFKACARVLGRIGFIGKGVRETEHDMLRRP